MPKTGISDKEWRERLASFVEGKFQFGRGQRPPKGSKRAQQLQSVESCPKHRSSTQLLDVLGRKIQCKCGFHKSVSLCLTLSKQKGYGSIIYLLLKHTIEFLFNVQYKSEL